MYGNITSHSYGFMRPFYRPQGPATAQGSEGAVTWKLPSDPRGLGEEESLAPRSPGAALPGPRRAGGMEGFPPPPALTPGREPGPGMGTSPGAAVHMPSPPRCQIGGERPLPAIQLLGTETH